MSHIFISYSSKDRSSTRKLAGIFEKQGWKVWWDKNITPGAAFDRAIGKALDAAYCIVVLWSPNSVKSSWVLDETYEGLSRKILVPALIAQTRLPFGYRRIQYVDLSTWKGSTRDAALGRLLKQIDAMQPAPAATKTKSKAGKATGTKAKPRKAKPAPVKYKRKLAGALDGKTIVFTGALSESRKAHAEKVETVGARFVNSVSGKTDYLVAGKKPGDTKLTAAKELGVKKISEKQWLKILNEAYRRTLIDKNVVFTGKLSEPRSQQEKLARELGAVVSQRISGKTDYLIVGEKPGKVKLDKAGKYDIRIIKESLWQEIVGALDTN